MGSKHIPIGLRPLAEVPAAGSRCVVAALATLAIVRLGGVAEAQVLARGASNTAGRGVPASVAFCSLR